MPLSKLFAIRGFLVFVSFMELVNALRSLLPSLFTLPHERLSESFIHKKIFSEVVLTPDTELILSQLFGFYSLLNAVVLVHTAFYCHYSPMLSLGIITVSCKIVFYMVQGYYYGTIPKSTGLQVPLLISFLSLTGLILLATTKFHNILSNARVGDENEELRRTMMFSRTRRRKEL